MGAKSKDHGGPWKPLEWIAKNYNISLRTLQDWIRDDKKIPRYLKRKMGSDWRIHADKYDNFLEKGM